jgi:hypothetical protein
MNAKGGVGKSFISALLLEFLTEKNTDAIGIDTDFNNPSLSMYESLNVTYLNIMPDGDTVDIRKFDDLVIFMVENEKTKNRDAVWDIGAGTMTPLFAYINANDTFSLLGEQFNIFVHIPVAIASESEADCLVGLENMITAFGNKCSFVVWSNEFFSSSGGHNIEDLEAYQKYKEKIFAVVKMAKKDVLFESAIEKKQKGKKTFADIPMDPSYNILEKSRIAKIQQEYWEMLSVIIPTGSNTAKKEEDKK